ncbi:type IV pilin protein [Thioalkalivibrio sp. ALR17-21]|uniref:type IV pilin protein n=1 Tax=Thioalkalivibrio sp. ALR17-21 TaxID=1269813 RepID=UPI0003FA9D78|nr:type IV pilin protein [Thioalkalivibrio sp. ALR17-21]
MTLLRRNEGFTLIELMIVIAILAIIVSIGYPAYLNHVDNSWRAKATGCLAELAQAMERERTSTMSYPGSLPNRGCRSEIEDEGRYTFERVDAQSDDTSFLIRANAQGRQANDGCGNLSLDHTGDRATQNGSVSQCW